MEAFALTRVLLYKVYETQGRFLRRNSCDGFTKITENKFNLSCCNFPCFILHYFYLCGQSSRNMYRYKVKSQLKPCSKEFLFQSITRLKFQCKNIINFYQTHNMFWNYVKKMRESDPKWPKLTCLNFWIKPYSDAITRLMIWVQM